MSEATVTDKQSASAVSSENETVTEQLRVHLACPRHRRELLEESRIVPEVVLSRGYRTVKSKVDLERCGFADYQQLVPALLIPMYSPTGKLVTHQVKSDVSRQDNDGKLVKYETPKGSEIHLDVHPSNAERVQDPSVPLWITEGVKKGDCLVSHGRCAVVLQGVWCWQKGGVPLPEWEDIKLYGRSVFAVFDSDVTTNPKVKKALERLTEFLRSRGALVEIVYLPEGKGGKKQGVDDYLAAGGTIEELEALATKELRDTRDTRDTDFQMEKMRELPKAPAFPTEALPDSCRKLALEAARALCCPVEFVAVPMVAALGSAIGNSRSIQLKEDWDELAIIYCAVVSGPGTKKTPPYKVAMAPVYQAQERLLKQYEEKKAEYEEEMRQYEAEKMRAKQEKVAPPPPPEHPVMESTFVSDTTVEALIVNLRNSTGGLGLFRDELSGLVRSLDQYKAGGKGSDRQFYLEAWNPPVIQRWDRKGNPEPMILHRPFLCISGSIQPQILPEIKAGREDGFLDRFLLSYPDPMSSRWSDEVISSGLKDTYRELYEGLRALEPDEDVETEHPKPRPVKLTLEARELIKDKVNALREEMDALGFPERLRGPWAKLETYLGRLALILALSRSTATGEAERVGHKDVAAAAELLDYFKSMTKKVYVGLYGESKEDRLAHDLGALLKQKSGFWEGSATELHELLGSPTWPERPDDLTKAVLLIDERSPLLSVERKKSGSSRSLRLTLQNGVPGVPGVPSDREHPERDTSLDDLAGLVREQEAPW